MFFHFVKKGDSVYRLSKQYGVKEEKIIEDNSLLDPANLVINQCLLIDNDVDNYVVQSGDTLGGLSNRFNMSIEEIKRKNPQIKNDMLYVGQELNLSPRKTTKIVNGYCYEFSSLSVIEKTLPYLTFLSIFSYRVNEDGTLSTLEDEKFIKLANRYNVRPIMVITNSKLKGGFSPSLARSIITNSENKNRLMQNIEKNLSKGYYGLNIDFEYINPEDKDVFAEFVKEISTYLKNKGYYVSISLAPKYSDSQAGLLYTSHDYQKLSQYVDHVILMTYEWGYTFGPSMPVAPYNEVKRVIDYAVTRIPKHKILMGLPNYGYDFIVPYKEKQKAKSITNPQAIPLAYKNSAQIERTKQGRTPYFKYTLDGINHEVQFDDPCSIEEKLSIIDDLGIAGCSIWTVSNYTAYYYLLLNHFFNIEKK